MACSDYNGKWWEALSDEMMRDAVLCPWQAEVGGAVFATIVLIGIVNLPIYIRQESAIMPTVITVIVGGILLVEMAAMGQALFIVTLLFTLGLGPVLVLRRIQTT